MKHVEARGTELCVLHAGGEFYAVGDRCPHMNAPLSMGTLDGTTLTCPLHFSKFDIRTGKKLSGPAQPKIDGIEAVPSTVTEYILRITAIMAPIRTCNLTVFPVRVEGTGIFVDI